MGFVFGKSAVLWSTCTRVLAEFKTCGLARGTSVRLIYQRELCDYLKKKKKKPAVICIQVCGMYLRPAGHTWLSCSNLCTDGMKS